MASSGWQGERILYGHLGDWPHTDWIGDLYISSIGRYDGGIHVKGLTRLYVRSDSGWYGNWYANRIGCKVSTQGDLTQIKGNTGTTPLDGQHFDLNFDVWIGGLDARATSYTFMAQWDDMQAGAEWLHSPQYWTLNFDSWEVPPSMDTSKIWSSNPGVYQLSSGISGGINWGVGHNRYAVSAVVSYSIDGTNVSYTAFSSNAKQDSYSFTINAQGENVPWNKVPDDETVTIKWIVSTNVGSTGGQVSQYCQKSYNAYVIEEGVNNGAPVEADLIVSNTSGSQPNKTIRRIDLLT